MCASGHLFAPGRLERGDVTMAYFVSDVKKLCGARLVQFTFLLLGLVAIA